MICLVVQLQSKCALKQAYEFKFEESKFFRNVPTQQLVLSDAFPSLRWWRPKQQQHQSKRYRERKNQPAEKEHTNLWHGAATTESRCRRSTSGLTAPPGAASPRSFRAEVALQRETGKSGATAARPRRRRGVSRDRVASRFRSRCGRSTSASIAPPGAPPPRSPCCGAVRGMIRGRAGRC